METEPFEGHNHTDALRKAGVVMVRIAKALKPLSPEVRIRVLRAVAALNGIDLREAKP